MPIAERCFSHFMTCRSLFQLVQHTRLASEKDMQISKNLVETSLRLWKPKVADPVSCDTLFTRWGRKERERFFPRFNFFPPQKIESQSHHTSNASLSHGWLSEQDQTWWKCDQMCGILWPFSQDSLLRLDDLWGLLTRLLLTSLLYFFGVYSGGQTGRKTTKIWRF